MVKCLQTQSFTLFQIVSFINHVPPNFIASQLNEWKLLAPYLGISEVKIEEIEIENKGIYEQKYQLLLEWQEQSGSQKATYHSLVEALK